MKWHLCLVILIALMAGGLRSKAVAADSPSHSPPLVQVERENNAVDLYEDRRTTHGFLFSVGYHNYTPKNYLSTLDLTVYSEIYGSSPIGMYEVQLSYKYNFDLGAMTAGLGYGSGSVSGTFNNTERTLSVTKPSLSIGYIADTLFSEPYFAPYFKVAVWQISVKESDGTQSFSGDTKMGFNYTIGALIQLNALDLDTSVYANKRFGLSNTYLDIFATQYTKTQDASDADTESELGYGAGLVFEF